ncbi:MAG: trypsin-like peptidase domain-containing protein [Parcubacteria group bacterium]
MENEKIENQTSSNSRNEVSQNPKPGRILFAVVVLAVSVFISATVGGLFGFLAAKNGADLLGKIRSGRIESLFSEKQVSQPAQIRQNIVQEDSAVIDVVKRTSPSVVSIVISKDIPAVTSDYFDPFGFFSQGSGNRDGNGATGNAQKQDIGGGTGFFITADGMIVTNRHVVDDSNASYTVVTSDDKKYPAKVLAVDPVGDIAVIKIEGDNFPTLELGDSGTVQVGETVVAIGNSLGQFSNTVSRGIISGLKRNVTAGGEIGQAENLTGIIQTDAAINPGNSGGPLLDIDGKVIGINVAIASGAQNIGFAIPSDQVTKIIDQVKKTGKISTPFLGVRYVAVDDALQKQNNLPYNYGALIARGNSITDFAVIPGSPADKAGLVENDIILEINGTKLDDTNGQGLTGLIAQYKAGDNVTLKIWHKGSTKDVSVTLEERK